MAFWRTGSLMLSILRIYSMVCLTQCFRFFLGIAESTPAPVFSLVTAMWFTPKEQPLRFGIWYGSAGFAGIIAGIAFYGIGHVHGALHPWQYQYLILGSITIIWGVIVVFILPDNPTEARFLSPKQKIWAVKRMQAAQTGIENTRFKPYQVKETLLDPKTWLLMLSAFCISIVNGAVSNFGSIIIASFGFSSFNSVLLSGAGGGVLVVGLIAVGYVLPYPHQSRWRIPWLSNANIFQCLCALSSQPASLRLHAL
jgi:MFS family permease